MTRPAHYCRTASYLWLVLHLVSHTAVSQPTPSPSRLSDEELVTFCLRQEGDVEHGRTLFMSNALACSQCHTIDGTRGRMGPDLLAVGDKFGRREIINSVLSPSARIADGYEQTLLQTTSGQVFAGVIKQATDDWSEIVGANGAPVRVRTAEVEERHTLDVSAMPQGLQSILTPTDLNDLVEYLVSLKQPENTIQLIHGMPREIEEISPPVDLVPIIPESLKFDLPVWMSPIPETESDFLVVEHQAKKIWYLDGEDVPAASRKTLFLDLGPAPPGEGRLSCLAFHPRFRENRKYYLYDRTTQGGQIEVVIIERELSADGRRDAGRGSREILRVSQSSLNHFGGWLAFGPDGFLYISFGDSGPQEDPHGNAQNPTLFRGKILRIDVDRTAGSQLYAIPPSNPFRGHPLIPAEVWALGFRAPWRCSFDRATGELWVGDVGQDRYEEVAIVRGGENHGWNVYEGFAPFSNQFRRPAEEYVPPVFAYGRKYGPSITGGYVYRADGTSSFDGKYICGDFESRRLFAITHHDRKLGDCRQIGISPQRIVSFAESNQGDIYVVGYEGLIYRIDWSRTKFK